MFRQHRHPFLIGVAGGTASGKTTVCDMIMQRLRDQCVVMLCQVREGGEGRGRGKGRRGGMQLEGGTS